MYNTVGYLTMWYCTHTSKFVTGEDQMLSELISCTGKQRDTENSGRYWMSSLDCGNGVTGVCLCPHSTVHVKYVQLFVYQLYLNNGVKNK